MKQLLQSWRSRNSILAGLATACVLAVFPCIADAAQFGDQFSVRLGHGPTAYSTYGHGRYGYGSSYNNGGYSRSMNNSFPLYGHGPYGYQNGYRHSNGYDTGYGNTGNSGWYPNYNTYSPYNSNYNNPYSTWSYSPYGYGVQRTYGW